MAARRKGRARGGHDALAQIRRAIRRIEKEGAALMRRARRDAARYMGSHREEALTALMKQARNLGADLEKRVRKSGHDVEKRAERAIVRIEKRLAAGFEATAKKLMLATRDDMVRLQRQVAELEHRVDALGGRLGEVPRIPLERIA
jgi:polyhydroxyalkanoate synthesis regulator phasin